jgi:sec-independent protein translocase protein TatA
MAFLSPSPIELIVIAVIALIVLGPSRLPEAARSVGKGMREMRNSFNARYDDDDPRPDEFDDPGDEPDDADDGPEGADDGPADGESNGAAKNSSAKSS